MTITSTPAPPTVTPPATRSTAGAVIGIILTVVGLVLATSGAVLLGALHGGNTLQLARTHLATPTAAFVTDATHIRDSINSLPPHGRQPTLHLSLNDNNSGKGIFVGVAPTSDVDRYLAGTSFEEINSIHLRGISFNLNPFNDGYAGHVDVDTIRHLGSALAAPPAAQPFWIAQASGPTANLAWKLSDDTKIVIMNLAPGPVAVAAKLSLSFPYLYPVGLAMAVIGAVLAVAGIATIIRTRQSGGRPVDAAGQTQPQDSQAPRNMRAVEGNVSSPGSPAGS